MGTYCYGDGSGNGGPDCPCMNNAPPSTGEGCINSLGTGALLTPSGDPSVSNDTLVMTATQYPPNTHGYFFAGTAQVNGGLGIQLGDGLRCIGGQVVRIGKVPPGGSNTLPHPGDPPLSQQYMIPAGARRYYQFFYRNPAGPCSNGFSLSNGVPVNRDLVRCSSARAESTVLLAQAPRRRGQRRSVERATHRSRADRRAAALAGLRRAEYDPPPLCGEVAEWPNAPAC